MHRTNLGRFREISSIKLGLLLSFLEGQDECSVFLLGRNKHIKVPSLIKVKIGIIQLRSIIFDIRAISEEKNKPKTHQSYRLLWIALISFYKRNLRNDVDFY